MPTEPPRVLALLDGTLADPNRPHLPVGDLGLMRGDGVFETVNVTDGYPRELDAHLDRLERSAALVRLPVPDRAAWLRCVDAAVRAWPDGSEMLLTLVYTRGTEPDGARPTAFGYGLPVSARRLAARRTGVSVVTLDRGYHPDVVARSPWLLFGVKSLSYAVNMAVLRHAAACGADDAVLLAADGTVLEGPTSTVVVARGHTLRTPPPDSGVLPGTTQAALFRAAAGAGWATATAPLRTADLYDADAVYLTSSAHLVTRVHTVDGRPLPATPALDAGLRALYEDRYRVTKSWKEAMT